MTSKQFTAACKEKGVEITSIAFNSKSVTLTYRYHLNGNQISSNITNTYTYHRPALKAIYDNHFINADKITRF